MTDKTGIDPEIAASHIALPATVLEVKGLGVKFWVEGNFNPAAVDMNYEVRRGEVLAVVGESGSGKSTSSMALLGLLPENARVAGSIQLLGCELRRVEDSTLRALGDHRGTALAQPQPRDAQALERAVELLGMVEMPNPEQSFHNEGPLPQTRFVIRKAIEAKLPVILLVNRTDRPDARIAKVAEEAYDLLLGLASDLVNDVPVVYASGRAGAASRDGPAKGEPPNNDDLEPLSGEILEHVPAPVYDDDAPLQAWHAQEGPDGRLDARRRHDEQYPAGSAGPGDIIAVAGFGDITIGETNADSDDVRPLPQIHVDDPVISMTIGTNTSPLVGNVKGYKLTARMVKDRLDCELRQRLAQGRRHRPSGASEVQGRGELALAILVENMRREGRDEIDGETYEPFDHITIDAPEEVRMEFIVPSRGLIGFRTEFLLTTTRNTGIANTISHGYETWAGHIVTRQNGSIVADRSGVVTPFAVIALQERIRVDDAAASCRWRRALSSSFAFVGVIGAGGVAAAPAAIAVVLQPALTPDLPVVMAAVAALVVG
ncbi:hypothetical protein QBC39DRAFT_417665 [Podospora conica]|nr:hypothetical protein QBC39DRAFT_417665 [Schizothecium conicum]